VTGRTSLLRPAVGALLVLAAASIAVAADSPLLKSLKKEYDALSHNHDDEASRARRRVLLEMFDVREEPGARRLLKKALGGEKRIDNRVAVVHLLAGCGDPKAFTSMLSGLKKERFRAPVLAIGRGVGFTPDANTTDLSAAVLKALKRAKGDLRSSLLEGLGGLGVADATPVLLAFEPKNTVESYYRNRAIGRCNGEGAEAFLIAELDSPYPAAERGAVHGLAAIGSDAALTAISTTALHDTSVRVVRAAATALAAAGHKPAAAEMAKELQRSHWVREREVLRQSLQALLGKDFGYDAEKWPAAAAGKPVEPTAPADLPKQPEFFGVPVATNSVLVMLDTSRSVQWMGRLEREIAGCQEFIRELPDDSEFAVWNVTRGAEKFQPDMVAVATHRDAAIEWLGEQKSGRGGLYVKKALNDAVGTLTRFDTIVFATDSHPWGETAEETSLETIETFRHMNRDLDIKLVIALVMPGGRFEDSERSETEIEERIEFLTQLAEESGGAFVHVEE